jgi:hypothetical protein
MVEEAPAIVDLGRPQGQWAVGHQVLFYNTLIYLSIFNLFTLHDEAGERVRLALLATEREATEQLDIIGLIKQFASYRVRRGCRLTVTT